MRQRFKLRLYCFSPPVMVATAIIELSLMLYALYKFGTKSIGRLAAITLFLLAVFQISEYNICGGFGLDAELWSRIGFMVIAMLPPLGIHLSMMIAKKDLKWFRYLAYLSGFIWVAIFGLTEKAFSGYACGGNYMIYQIKEGYGHAYMLYYYFWLFAAIALSLYFMLQATKQQRKSLLLLIIGYLLFIGPTSLINGINPKTIEGLPSILCGFAVFFAIVLTFGILPNEAKIQRRSKKKLTK